jgi:hypothetical protein
MAQFSFDWPFPTFSFFFFVQTVGCVYENATAADTLKPQGAPIGDKVDI